jgi:hypothetical protein
MKIKTLLAVVTALGLWNFTVDLQAQVPQTVTAFNISVTVIKDINDDTVTTSATTTHVSRKLSDLLAILALDEHAAALYPNTNFPAGAKLGVDENGVFQVWDKTNALLVVVSNVLSFVMPTGNQVYSGKRNDSSGLASPTINSLFMGKIVFDDTAIVGGQDLQFFLQGTVKRTQTDAVNTRNATYTETITSQLTGATGDGTSEGEPFIATGTTSASGKATFQLPVTTGVPK